MIIARRATALLGATLVSLLLAPSLGARATTALRVTSSVTTTITASMPILRLHFNAPVRANAMPRLTIRPALATKWQQIGARDLQAVATGAVRPLVQYTIVAPTALRCATRCSFTAVRDYRTNVTTNVLWEEQLLATLKYLPLTFTANATSSDAAVESPGTFTWAYPSLPARLASQWRVGVDNVLVKGALMAFQNVHQLPTTGVADPTTWNRLVAAVHQGQVDPNPYEYVDVSEASPEVLTLYVNGAAKFHTLVNTGVPGAVTELGTYPVYYRYTYQIMRGTNLDGSHYADPVSWVSYFHGGDALHQFYRYSYGSPQSLGCVEMVMAAAKYLWPFTPIGTLVTVR